MHASTCVDDDDGERHTAKGPIHHDSAAYIIMYKSNHLHAHRTKIRDPQHFAAIFWHANKEYYRDSIVNHILLSTPVSRPVSRTVCHYMSAIVTSTSTPGSIDIEVICFTTSEGEWRSMIRLWIRISNRSYVFVPSPLGAFLVVILKVFVGNLTGPQTCKFLSFAPWTRSCPTTSKGALSAVERYGNPETWEIFHFHK